MSARSLVTRKAILGGLAVAVALSVLSGCSSDTPAASSSSGSSELTTVTVAAVPNGVMHPVFQVGVDQGIFEAHGLDIQIETLASPTDTIGAVVQGSADIAYTDLYSGSFARDSGFDIGFLSGGNSHANYHYLLVPGDSTLKTSDDLFGKTVAIGPSPGNLVSASIALEASGVSPDDVVFTTVADQTTFPALLKTGQVDAAFVGSPLNGLKWQQEEGFRTLIDADAAAQGIQTDFPINGWWSTWDWYGQNTAIAEAFVASLVEAHAYWDEQSDETDAGFILEQTELDLVELDKTIPGVLERFVRVAELDAGPADEAKISDWLAVGTKYADVPSIPLDELLLPTALQGD